MGKCNLCPRHCLVERENQIGYCGVDDSIRVARAALHMWEEPCISGEKGSGTVFFSGCNMRCVFCQNYPISGGEVGQEISVERLSEIFFELAEKGANNINLVTPDHYIPQIREAILLAKSQGFHLPFLYNSSAYVEVESLKMLVGLIDIYLPDFKFYQPQAAFRYAKAMDYPEVARKAISEMVRQIRDKWKAQASEADYSLCRFNGEGIMTRGVIVRHLVMPKKVLEAKMIVRELYETYGDDIYISLMNQYTPLAENPRMNTEAFPELYNKVTEREYDSVIRYAVDLGITNGFMQEGEAAAESFIPQFDLEGVNKG